MEALIMPRSLTMSRHLSLAPVACFGALALACAGSSRPKDVDRLQAHVTGLTGQGLVLLVNEVTEIPVASVGTVDLGAMPPGSIFSVAVKSPPANPPQRCSVTPQSGTMQSGGATVEVACADDDHAFSGLIQGLVGSGLVLELSVEGHPAEDVAVAAQAVAAAFSTRGLVGAHYALAVKTPPSAPSQTCSVENPSGQVGAADIQFRVVCSASTSVVTGSVAGLRASGLVLLLNGSELTVPAAATSFSFPPIANGIRYTVSVGAQPAGQRCAVTNPSGEAGVTTAPVAVTCVDTHAFAGSVTGLAGSGLTLELTAGDAPAESVQVPAGATSFAFTTRAAVGDGFAVGVKAPPAGPAQDCSVTPGRGAVGQADVQLQVACTTRTFTVGGTVNNLLGTAALQLNSTATVSLAAGATSFTFPPLPDRSHYRIEVATQPSSPGQTCKVSGGEGDLAGQDVTSVQVTCQSWDVSSCGPSQEVCAAVPNGYATCVAGECGQRCNAGYGLSGTQCIPITTDPSNCGMVGNVCPGVQNGQATCSGGVCGLACDTGYGLSASRCIPITADTSNCGAVGRVCSGVANGYPTCASSTCGFACNTGYGASGGACIPTTSDPSNCGAVGRVCPGVANGYSTCASSTCGFACNADYGASGGACIPTTSDPSNCGAVGRVCPGVANGYSTCASSTCGFACNAGYLALGKSCLLVNDVLATPTLAVSARPGVIVVTWTTPTIPATYRLERQAAGEATFTEVFSGDNVGNYADRRSYGTYAYRVRACNGSGCSGYSWPVSLPARGWPPCTEPDAVMISLPDLGRCDNCANECESQIGWYECNECFPDSGLACCF